MNAKRKMDIVRTLVNFGFRALIALGFLLILGTAGLSDLDTIGFGEIVKRVAIGLALSGVGFFGVSYGV